MPALRMVYRISRSCRCQKGEIYCECLINIRLFSAAPTCRCYCRQGENPRSSRFRMQLKESAVSDALICAEEQPSSAARNTGDSSGDAGSGFGLDSETVIHGRCDPLGAAQVTLGGLHGNVPEEKLNLLKFAASGAAEPRATST